MSEIIFHPKYTIKQSLDILSIGLFFLLALLFSVIRFGLTLPNILGIGLLIYFPISFSHLYIRRIVFTPSNLLVEKYIFGSTIKIDYSNITDIGTSKIITRNGEVSFAAMSNTAQLHALLFELIQQGKIDIEKLEYKTSNKERTLQKSFLPTIIISLLLISALLLFWYYHQSALSQLSLLIISGIISATTALGVYWLNKRYTKNQ